MLGYDFIKIPFFLILALVLANIPHQNAFAQADQAAAASWAYVDVQCTDGTVHEDVTVTWGLVGYSLKISAADGTAFTLSPSQISAISDRHGADITNLIAEASPAQDVNFALIGDRRVIPFEFDFMLTAGGSGIVNKGSGSLQTGGALIAGARIPFGPLAHCHLLYRRQGIAESEIHSGGRISSQVDEFHFLFGYRLTHPKENSNYAYMELGLSLVRFERRYNYELRTWTEHGATKAGVTVQGGVVFPLSSDIGFDLGGIMMVRPTLAEDSPTVGLLAGINGALAFSF